MSIQSMNGNILTAVDVETSGVWAGYNEIIQIAAVPLNHHFEPHPDMRPFYLNIKPDYFDRIEKEAVAKHRINPEDLKECPSQDRSVELFYEWFKGLKLPFGKRLVPLAHNFAFERGFLTYWQGVEGMQDVWQSHPRDTMTLAATINDLYVWHGRKQPFKYLNLVSLCKMFDIELDNAHDALADCLATAKLYAALMRFMGG